MQSSGRIARIRIGSDALAVWPDADSCCGATEHQTAVRGAVSARQKLEQCFTPPHVEPWPPAMSLARAMQTATAWLLAERGGSRMYVDLEVVRRSSLSGSRTRITIMQQIGSAFTVLSVDGTCSAVRVNSAVPWMAVSSGTVQSQPLQTVLAYVGHVGSTSGPATSHTLCAHQSPRALDVPMSEFYPSIAQCAVVATALKVLLFPA
jgi:hypothetical protein